MQSQVNAKKCYILKSGPDTWFNANSKCAIIKGATLVSIDSSFENAEVNSKLQVDYKVQT